MGRHCFPGSAQDSYRASRAWSLGEALIRSPQFAIQYLGERNLGRVVGCHIRAQPHAHRMNRTNEFDMLTSCYHLRATTIRRHNLASTAEPTPPSTTVTIQGVTATSCSIA